MSTRQDVFSQVDFATLATLMQLDCLTPKGALLMYASLHSRYCPSGLYTIDFASFAKELGQRCDTIYTAFKSLVRDGMMSVVSQSAGHRNKKMITVHVVQPDSEALEPLKGKSFQEVKALYKLLNRKAFGKPAETPVENLVDGKSATRNFQLTENRQLEVLVDGKSATTPYIGEEEKEEEEKEERRTPSASASADLIETLETDPGAEPGTDSGAGAGVEPGIEPGIEPQADLPDEEIVPPSSPDQIKAMREDPDAPKISKRIIGGPKSPMARRSQVPAAIPLMRPLTTPRCPPPSAGATLGVPQSETEESDMTEAKSRTEQKRDRWAEKKADVLAGLSTAAGATANDPQAAAQRLVAEAIQAKRARSAAQRLSRAQSALPQDGPQDDSLPISLVKAAAAPGRLHALFFEAMAARGYVADEKPTQAQRAMWKTYLGRVPLDEAEVFVPWIIDHWGAFVQPKIWRLKGTQPSINILVSTEIGNELRKIHRDLTGVTSALDAVCNYDTPTSREETDLGY